MRRRREEEGRDKEGREGGREEQSASSREKGRVARSFVRSLVSTFRWMEAGAQEHSTVVQLYAPSLQLK